MVRQEIDKILAHRELCIRDYWYFYRHVVWPIIEPGTEFVECWAHRYVAEHLQALVQGQIANNALSIQVPPRFGKSNMATIGLPAWTWLNQGWMKFLFASFNLKLSGEHARQRLKILEDVRYKVLWSGDLLNANPYSLDNTQGGKFANLARAKTTGSGADLLHIDDLNATTDSVTEIDRAVRLYKGGLRSRLNQSGRSMRLNISQRVGLRCMGAIALEEGWEVITLEMEATRPQTFIYPLSTDAYHRRDGEILNAARDSKGAIEELKADPEVWECQYQQNPAPPGGTIYFRHHFRPVESSDPGITIISVDSANSAHSASAYWAVHIANLSYDGRITIYQVIRDVMDYAQGKNTLTQAIHDWAPNYVLIENKSSGQSLLSELPLLFDQSDFIPINPKGTKQDRAKASVALLPVDYLEGPWCPDYFAEVITFPRSAYADQVDSLSQLLNWLRVLREKARVSKQLGIFPTKGEPGDDVIALYRSLGKDP